MVCEMFRFSNINLFDTVKEFDREFSQKDMNMEPKVTVTYEEMVTTHASNLDGKKVNNASQKSRKKVVQMSCKASV